MEENEHIHKHLKDSLGQFLVQPKLGSFDDIMKKVEKKRRRRFLIFFLSGMFFLSVGTMVLFNYFDVTKTISTDPLTVSTVTNANSVQGHKEPVPALELNSGARPKPDIEPDKVKENSAAPDSSPSGKNGSIPERKKVFPVKTTGKPQAAFLAVENPPSRSTSETYAESAEGTLPGDRTDFTEVDKLDSKTLHLLPANTPPVPDLNHPAINDILFPGKDSLKKKQRITFLVGAVFNPQLGSYHFQNNGAAPDQSFSSAYLKNKKEQNNFLFNYAWGVKSGVLINDKWEVLLGMGFQRYNQVEKIIQLVPNGPMPILSNANQYDSFSLNAVGVAAESGKTYESRYTYYDFSLEGSRIMNIGSLIKLKVGAGFHIQQLFFRKNSKIITTNYPDQFYYGNGYNPAVNLWQSVVHLKGGLIEDLSKTIQVQFCPNLFYMPNSMFKNNYVIKQKAFGFGVEVLFLFKIR